MHILQSETALGHLVLLDPAPFKVVDAARWVDLGLVLSRYVREFGTSQDVEVVVSRVATRVPLGADSSAEDDEILGDACTLISFNASGIG